MNGPGGKIRIIVVVVLFVAAGLYACARTASLAKRHPVEVEGPPVCRDCHTDWRTAMNHTQDFVRRHRFSAAQKRPVCESCHALSFCADCHANKEELKPGDKIKDKPWRTAPHRGDYLTQHRIDGRINPASCFPCHGRQNNARCRVCHR